MANHVLDLVGPFEISQRLGVKRQTVATWRIRNLLPEPLYVISRIPIWNWPDIKVWAKSTNRLDP